jgi:hypothetical protein
MRRIEKCVGKPTLTMARFRHFAAEPEWDRCDEPKNADQEKAAGR